MSRADLKLDRKVDESKLSCFRQLFPSIYSVKRLTEKLAWCCCWRKNIINEHGLKLIWPLILTFFVQLGSGDAQTLCITDDDNVWSWGDGDYGKLGRGGSDGCKIPIKVDSLAGLGKLTQSVWKSPIKSHSKLRAKRASFSLWMYKSSLKMPKFVLFGQFLKTWRLRSNSVTR